MGSVRIGDNPSTKRRAASPQGQREPEVLVLTCLEPWQQCQSVVPTDEPEIVRRQSKLHHPFSGVGKGHERIVTAKKNLRRRDEARPCRKSGSESSASDVVMKYA